MKIYDALRDKESKDDDVVRAAVHKLAKLLDQELDCFEQELGERLDRIEEEVKTLNEILGHAEEEAKAWNEPRDCIKEEIKTNAITPAAPAR